MENTESNATLLKDAKEYSTTMHTMFMDKNAQYHDDVNSPQINL